MLKTNHKKQRHFRNGYKNYGKKYHKGNKKKYKKLSYMHFHKKKEKNSMDGLLKDLKIENHIPVLEIPRLTYPKLKLK